MSFMALNSTLSLSSTTTGYTGVAFAKLAMDCAALTDPANGQVIHTAETTFGLVVAHKLGEDLS